MTKLKRLCAVLMCAVLVCGLLPEKASAKVADGVYLAPMNVYYTNPDTGKIDDAGGSANAALGEGMCRSATGKQCLVEVKDGETWITVRLNEQNSCSSVKLSTRTGSNQYAGVKYKITKEHSGGNTVDYRIKVKSPDQKIKCEMHVDPMGRDVVWYMGAGALTPPEPPIRTTSRSSSSWTLPSPSPSPNPSLSPSPSLPSPLLSPRSPLPSPSRSLPSPQSPSRSPASPPRSPVSPPKSPQRSLHRSPSRSPTPPSLMPPSLTPPSPTAP